MKGGFSKQKKGLFCRAKGGGAGIQQVSNALDGGDGDESAGANGAAAVRVWRVQVGQARVADPETPRRSTTSFSRSSCLRAAQTGSSSQSGAGVSNAWG